MPQLISPNTQYQTSYLTALAEYQAEGLPFYQNFDLAQIKNDFQQHLQQLTSGDKTTWWLVEGNEYLGRVTIDQGRITYDVRPTQRRKGYGKLILELGLAKAKSDLGLSEVLITCDVNNIGSNKIIQANGGLLEGKVTHQAALKNEYRFDLKKT